MTACGWLWISCDMLVEINERHEVIEQRRNWQLFYRATQHSGVTGKIATTMLYKGKLRPK